MSVTLLTKARYDLLIATQKKFDSRVPSYDVESIKVAYFVEFIEWLNTVEFFKAWKKNKGKPMDVQLEELADVLAFGLSLASYHDCEYGEKDFEEATACVEIGVDTFVKKSRALLDLLNETTSDFGIFVKLPIVFASVYYTVDELIEAYYKKMDVNHARQDSDY